MTTFEILRHLEVLKKENIKKKNVSLARQQWAAVISLEARNALILELITAITISLEVQAQAQNQSQQPVPSTSPC